MIEAAKKASVKSKFHFAELLKLLDQPQAKTKSPRPIPAKKAVAPKKVARPKKPAKREEPGLF
jgi:hypothetical protein